MKYSKFLKIFEKYGARFRKEELFELVNIIEKKRPSVIVELGVEKGGSLKFWSLLQPDELLIGIDQRLYPDRTWDFTKDKKITFIEGDCHTEEILNKMKEVLNGRKIDFLLIDETHTYEAVKQDLENFLPLMNKKGIIAFHDIRAPNTEKYKSCTVKKYFDEIKRQFSKIQEILVPGEWPGSDGIGVIYLD